MNLDLGRSGSAGETLATFIAVVTRVTVEKRKSMLTAATYRSTRSLARVFKV